MLTVRETSSASWLASHSSTSPDMLAVIGKVSVDTVMNRELRQHIELQTKVRKDFIITEKASSRERLHTKVDRDGTFQALVM